MTQGRAEVAALLDRHAIRPRKALGQNFLVDPNLVDRIVRLAAPEPGDKVLEIGPGTGALTLGLAGTGASITAVEVDARLRPVLEEVLADTDVSLRFEDATRIDWVHETRDGPWTVVANLPYNVGTSLLLETMRTAPNVVRWVVMVQREVADRLTAEPGGRIYGLPAVVAGLHARLEERFAVPPQVFLPRPPVQSAVVALRRERAPDPVREAAISIAGKAFRQRRKMLRASLADLAGVEAALSAAGVEPTARPEQVSPAQFLAIADAFHAG